ncbi:MAG: hypothetical protein RSB41_00390 [Bacilli bacterium]
MKKTLILIISILLVFPTLINAECSNETLIEYSKSIQTTIINTSYPNTIELHISGINDYIYIKVKNNLETEEKIYTSKDKNEYGFIVLSSPNINKQLIYEVLIYSKDTGCGEKPLRTIKTKTEKYNKYSSYAVCKEAKDFKYCLEYYDTDNLSENEFLIEVNKYIESSNKTMFDKVLEVILKYGIYVLVPIIVVGGFFIIKTIIYKKKVKHETK